MMRKPLPANPSLKTPLSAARDHFSPGTAFEDILVSDIAECTAAIRRYRNRIFGLERAFLANTLERAFCQPAIVAGERKQLPQAEARRLAQAFVYEDGEAYEEADASLAALGIVKDHVTAMAHMQSLPLIEQIERLIAAKDQQRRKLQEDLTRLNRRRATATIEDAEAEDVEP